MKRRIFLNLLGTTPAVAAISTKAHAKPLRPNIIVIMVDDMGFSDPGCFGGEIDTPNLDKLADEGIRFTQFYNTAKCEPSRVTLMTGIYHPEVDREKLLEHRTISEVLKTANYSTVMTGKWHIKGDPISRGFDRYFGHLSGATNFFWGDKSFRLNQEEFKVPKEGFYTTDANVDYANKFLSEVSKKADPFFLYIAFNAPHYPLQAHEQDIKKYKGRFDEGWDVLREKRYQRQIKMKLFKKNWKLSERTPDAKAWNDLTDEEKKKEAYTMEVYAAMIDSIDQNIGKLMNHLKKIGAYDNTALFFFSDNGGCPFQRTSKKTLQKNLEAHDPQSYWTYHYPWANLSNTPFRWYKQNQHEGGISSGAIAWYPSQIKNKGDVSYRMSHLVDIMATCMDLSGAEYPEEFKIAKSKLSGKSLLPTLQGKKDLEHEKLFFQFSKNRALRTKDWKLVQVKGNNNWELYEIDEDRTELNDVASQYPEVVKKMDKEWMDWYSGAGRKWVNKNQGKSGSKNNKNKKKNNK